MVVIGQRIQVGDHYGLVKYIGLVEGTEGEWLGVEWEEAGRGKHDGTYKNERYFEAKPQHGSFVRSHKLSPGFSFSDVLKKRYDDVTGVGDAMSILNKDTSRTTVELVGLSDADVARASLLTNLVMREESIDSVGDEDYIAEKCVNTENLDMSLNLLHDINDIVRILHLMPQLKSVQLKGNILCKRNVVLPTVCHGNLERIFLANSGLSWTELCMLAEHMPNIRELYISGSTLEIGPIPPRIFQHLSALDLQCSNISDWNILKHLCGLPLLQTLIVSNNTLTHIDIPPGSFPSIHSISFDNNQIGAWSSVAQLRNLPHLATLRIRHNPLITGPALDMRLLVVAMLPDVKKLNGTPISNTERLQADIFYLKYFSTQYLADEAGFHDTHARYMNLVKEYGEPEGAAPKIASIKEQSIVVTVAKPDGKEFEKKLLKTTLVKNLHLIVQRQCKILPKNQTLYWIDQEEQKTELDDPTRDLAYFNIYSDCTIYVESK